MFEYPVVYFEKTLEDIEGKQGEPCGQQDITESKTSESSISPSQDVEVDKSRLVVSLLSSDTY